MKLLALLTLIPGFAQAATLTCSLAGKPDHVFTIQENVPGKGLATLNGAGVSAVLKFTETVAKKDPHGCLTKVEKTKTYFHPYYDYVVKSSFTIGNDLTRCAGMLHGHPNEFSGTYSAEMQQPVAVECKSDELVTDDLLF